MEHLGDEFDAWGFVGVLFFEMHYEAEGAVFEGGICGANDDGVPEYMISFDLWRLEGNGEGVEDQDGGRGDEVVIVPGHDIVGYWGGGNAGWRVGLHSLLMLSAGR